MNGALLPLAAIGAGVLSASSPCVLPVLPGYIAAVSAPGGSLSSRLRGTLGFIAGFTAVFTALGATASALGGLLFDRLDTALTIAGVALIALGLHSIGLFKSVAISRDRRPIALESVHGDRMRSVALGVAFGFGWTPCIGPILATILTKAASDTSLPEGVALLLLYSLGLGIPFVAVAVWLERSTRARQWILRRSILLQRLGGIAMIIVGIGYVTGTWSTIFTGVQAWLAKSGWPPI